MADNTTYPFNPQNSAKPTPNGLNVPATVPATIKTPNVQTPVEHNNG